MNPKQLFDRQHIGHVVRQGREIIQSIRVRNELGVGHVLGDLLIAAVEIADLRNGPGNDLAIQLEHDPQHAMRRRMRRPHVQDYLFAMKIFEFFRPRLPRRRFRHLDFARGGHVSPRFRRFSGRVTRGPGPPSPWMTAPVSGAGLSCFLFTEFLIKQPTENVPMVYSCFAIGPGPNALP